MGRALVLEFKKMKRLRTLPILAGMIAAVVAMGSMTLFRGSVQADIAQGIDVWPNHLSTYCMMAALLSPIVLAVIASRQTEMEFSGQGWTLSATAGFTPGQVVRAKLLALSLIIAVATIMQSAAVIALGLAFGIQTPIPLGVISLYTLMLAMVNIAFTAAFVALASVVENQLVALAAGLLSAFISMFGLLMPADWARLNPWGYYAVIMPVGWDGEGFAYITPGYVETGIFLALMMAAFVAFTHRLNYLER